MILLVFRDPLRGGTSVEEIYHELIEDLKPTLNISAYYYQDNRSPAYNAWSIKKLKPALVHITSDVYFISPLLSGIPSILTIHDIGRYKELSGLKKKVYEWIWLKIPIMLAKKVISVSDFTSRDIKENLGKFAVKKLVRIYNPLPSILKPVPKEFNRHRPVILQVGTLPNKNIETTIKALAGLQCQFVVLGILSDAQKKLLQDNNIAYSNYYNLDFEEVYQKYIECDIVTFVSLYEGFGMPVIEAQAVGRPVICALNSSLREVAGDGALFVRNVLDEIEIRDKIKNLITNPSLSRELVDKGYKNVEKFERRSIVQTYMDLYTSVLAKGA